jgi:hypothetical protein
MQTKQQLEIKFDSDYSKLGIYFEGEYIAYIPQNLDCFELLYIMIVILNKLILTKHI